MGKASEALIEIIAGLALFLLGTLFTVSLFTLGNRYDDALVEKTRVKQSVIQTYAYLNHVKTYDAAEVISDIMESNLYIKRDGVMLPDDKIAKAREGNETAITYLRNTFTDTYTKTYEYDINGNIIGLDFNRE